MLHASGAVAARRRCSAALFGGAAWLHALMCEQHVAMAPLGCGHSFAKTRLEAIASRLEAIVSRSEAIASRLEAIVSRSETIATRLEGSVWPARAVCGSLGYSCAIPGLVFYNNTFLAKSG